MAETRANKDGKLLWEVVNFSLTSR
jgi:hypothetical protein